MKNNIIHYCEMYEFVYSILMIPNKKFDYALLFEEMAAKNSISNDDHSKIERFTC